MPNYIRNLPGAALGGLRNLRTVATAGKNIAFGKTWPGFFTRVAGDQVVLGGAIGNKIKQGLHTGIVRGRLWGRDEIEKDNQRGEREREEILNNDRNRRTRQPNNKGFRINTDGSFTYGD